LFTLTVSAADLQLLQALLALPERDAVRSNHWLHFGGRNRITVDGNSVRVEGGAGFDGTYEQNFRPATLREHAGLMSRKLRGRSEEAQHLAAFRALWPDAETRLAAGGNTLGGRMTPQKVLACHYFALLEPFLQQRAPRAYLEIGAGSGYLAALVHAAFGSRVAIVDLPEILPFSLLYLRQRFPAKRFGIEGSFMADTDFVFLTPPRAAALESGTFDLAVNTASFGEMLPAQVREYFALLRRTMRPQGVFFTVNRVEKWMNEGSQPIEQNAPGKGVAVRFDDYPWLASDRILIDQLSAMHARIQPESPMKVRLCELAPA
jgi:SAM-dependent methyltransferase